MTRSERLHRALDCVCDRMGIGNDGTSEGVRKAWQTRKRGGAPKAGSMAAKSAAMAEYKKKYMPGHESRAATIRRWVNQRAQ